MALFDGRVAMVTGAANGIGRASAAMLARHGARVVCADVDDAGGAASVEAITAEGGTAMFVHTDVSRPEAVDELVRRTVEEFGRLDIAHNNAGIVGAGQPIPDYPIDDWERGIGVMLSGVFYGMKYQIPAILAHGDGGAIVNTSSGAGLIGFPGMCAYVAAKHGVIGLTRTAALEYGAQGIRINAICPGTARTKMVNDWLGSAGPDHLAENEAQVVALHPIGRIAEPDEIAELVIWLASPAASFMSGAAVPIDGGYTIQ